MSEANVAGEGLTGEGLTGPAQHDGALRRAAREARPRISVRNVLLWWHRYCGLSMAVFLFIGGITGSILAYNSELEHVFAGQLFARPQPGVPTLNFAELIARGQELVPHGRVTGVGYTEADRVTVRFSPRTNPATGRPWNLGFTEFFIDPWTGKETGRRIRGDLSQGQVNWMPFLYDLHWRLAAGDTGQWIMGIVSVIWTLDCFVAFYLTLPRGRGGFWLRWKYAWRIKWRASPFRVNFDVHRASGLWLWTLLFVFAWSSVMMNIRPLFETVMHGFFDYQRPREVLAFKAHPNTHPRLDWRAAEAQGRRLMEAESREHGFTFGAPLALSYSVATGAYAYEVRGSRDLFERAPKGGSTRVTFDGDTGELRVLSQPTGERAGATFESWMYALHMARIFGRVYQFVVFVVGLVVAVLPATGVYIWWRKRNVRAYPGRRLVSDVA